MPTKPKGTTKRAIRGPGVLIRVTWPMIAQVLGVSVHTAKKWGTGKGRRFDPRDLRSVVRFVMARGQR